MESCDFRQDSQGSLTEKVTFGHLAKGRQEGEPRGRKAFQAVGTAHAKALSTHKQRGMAGDELREGLRDHGRSLAVLHWRDSSTASSDMACFTLQQDHSSCPVVNSLRWERGRSREAGLQGLLLRLLPSNGSLRIHTLRSLPTAASSPCLHSRPSELPRQLLLWGQSSTALKEACLSTLTLSYLIRLRMRTKSHLLNV